MIRWPGDTVFIYPTPLTNQEKPMKCKGIAVITFMLATASNLAFAKDVKIPEGTSVSLQVLEKLTSATATEGQRFDLVLDDDIRVDG
jgi:hypothetical protein